MLLIMGCTAGGKSRLAFELARRVGGEILSVDSMKVYRRMDIGTAKPPREHLQQIRHHLIDVVEPSEPFSLGRYLELADAAIADMQQRAFPIIAVGGTGMYLRALLEGVFEGPSADENLRRRLLEQAQNEGLPALHARLQEVDAESAGRIHPNDQKRIIRALEVYELTGKPISQFHTHFRSGNFRYPWKLIEIRRDKEDASRRINARVKKMVEQGLVDEVKSLLEKGLSPQATQAVGYAEIIAHLQGDGDLEKAIEQIKINTRRLAKSQRTWFRSFPDKHVLDVTPDNTAEALAEHVIASKMD